MLNKINFKPRLYQETILHSCLKNNTLVVLPTGMGKTKVGILAIVNRITNYPSSKALFLTPTKPLANQIYKEIKKSTNEKKISIFTGKIIPEKRKELWKDSRIIVSTPQCIENDLINGSINISEVSTLILDEAHRAVQDYSYTWIIKEYHKKAKYERIIGLTASPGTDISKISEVCKNLYSDEIEIRTEGDPDMKPYIQNLKIEKEFVDLPDEFKKIKKYLEDTLISKIKKIKYIGTVNLSTRPTKKELLNSQAMLQGEIARGKKDFNIFNSISLLTEIIKINHAIEMLETQGNYSLNDYLKSIFENKTSNRTKAAKNLEKDLNFKSAYILSNKLELKNVKHPKQIKLKKIIKDFIAKNPNAKIMIFNSYRNSVKKLEEDLNKLKGINAKMFIGQANRGGIKLRQKEQIEIIKKFGEGIVNCLISTSIGEEGLDIPHVDLVVFYEPIPSAIRFIQRKGRTARHSKGEIKILLTKNTKDEVNYWISQRKEKKMYSALEQVRKKLIIKKQPKIKDFIEKTKCMVHIDSREGKSGLANILHDLGINVKLRTLTSADIIISNEIGIERKTPLDFVNSLLDKRIFSQIKNLRENFEKPLVIIEGIEDIYSVRNVHPNAIRGMLSTITLSYGVPILYTKNKKDTAELIKIISLKEQKPESNELGLRLTRKPITTKEQQEFIIESLPGIGPSRTKLLLKEFKTIKKIANSKKEELEKVEGIGKKRAKEIERILGEIYDF